MEKQAATAQAEERYNDSDVQDPTDRFRGAWFKCVCHDCGWFGLSRDAAGGEPTGGDDYEDVRCPKCDGGLHDPKTRDIVIARAAFKEGLIGKNIEERPRWIPVAERLPEPTAETEGRHSREVLVKVVDGAKVFHEVGMMCYYVESTQFWSCGMNNKIVAWMEIPE